MSIFPLPVFEEDANPANRDAMSDQERYEQLVAPTTIVVRTGYLRTVAEYPYNGEAKPGCGSKLVARTHRGTELVEMLTTTCPNSGCGQSVSRKDMLKYIEQSGGKDYPFRKDGRILRVASVDDLNRWSAIKATAHERVKIVKSQVQKLELDLKIIEVEPVLSEEMLTIYFMAEERIDFRDLVKKLAAEFECRIEMRQVGARDEARIVADYERCGQHCCCKGFLKVLKPVSMRSAKTQKATLDPLKISGRCGRLMCCLRYEDESYETLKKNLPHRKTRVGTPEGPGIVIDSKILVQLVLVQLEEDGRNVAVAVEDLCDPDNCPTKPVEPDPFRGMSGRETRERTDDKKRNQGRRKSRSEQQEDHKNRSRNEARQATPETGDRTSDENSSTDDQDAPRKKRRRKRRRGKKGDAKPATEGTEGTASSPPEASGESDGAPKKKRRRRRRRRGKGPGDGESGNTNDS